MAPHAFGLPGLVHASQSEEGTVKHWVREIPAKKSREGSAAATVPSTACPSCCGSAGDTPTVSVRPLGRGRANAPFVLSMQPVACSAFPTLRAEHDSSSACQSRPVSPSWSPKAFHTHTPGVGSPARAQVYGAGLPGECHSARIPSGRRPALGSASPTSAPVERRQSRRKPAAHTALASASRTSIVSAAPCTIYLSCCPLGQYSHDHAPPCRQEAHGNAPTRSGSASSSLPRLLRVKLGRVRDLRAQPHVVTPRHLPAHDLYRLRPLWATCPLRSPPKGRRGACSTVTQGIVC
mmetsp:Transcript_11392/g.41693  ORF Transcript_11392/g.41693 Transcript_11392/m.41693 type:complete len:293 (+) Transcript_11392:935-1813(+)|eukprot:scaffold3166_cov399-Prasinococcus_capsulatus_cf.AAC.2